MRVERYQQLTYTYTFRLTEDETKALCTLLRNYASGDYMIDLRGAVEEVMHASPCTPYPINAETEQT